MFTIFFRVLPLYKNVITVSIETNFTVRKIYGLNGVNAFNFVVNAT